MGAISLYRGNLHRVPNPPPRQWPMPPHAISLRHFKLLTRKRSQALARLHPASTTPAATATATSTCNLAGDDEEEKGKDDDMGVDACTKPETSASHHLLPQVSIPQPKIEEGTRQGQPQQEPIMVDASTPNPPTDSHAKMEISSNWEVVRNQDRKEELEKKLQVLNEKKHHLVQMLKQILNAEEEIKRRSIQSSVLRPSVPLQTETAVDMGSVTRHAQKLTVEVNFGGDLGGESDAAANNNILPRNLHPMHSTSPSAASLMRPAHGALQHNMAFRNPRSSIVAAGHGQTPAPNAMTAMGSTIACPPSNAMTTMGIAIASPPSRLAPTAQSGHTTSLPPVSAGGTHFNPSTPSPASGGASSVFRDSHLTSSS